MYHSSRGLSWQQKEEPETEEAVETTTWWDCGRAAEVARKQLKSCLEQWIRGDGDDGKRILELPSLEAEDWSRNCWHCWGPRAPAPSLIAGSLIGTKIAAAKNQRRQHVQSAEPWTDRKTQVSELHAERLKHEFLAPKTFTSHKAWKLLALPVSLGDWGSEDFRRQKSLTLGFRLECLLLVRSSFEFVLKFFPKFHPRYHAAVSPWFLLLWISLTFLTYSLLKTNNDFG